MGKTAVVNVRVGGAEAQSTVLLEGDVVIVSKSALRRRVALTADTRKAARVTGGWLRVGDVEVSLGAQAQAWLDAIRQPKSVATKLGLTAGQRVVVRGELPDDVAQLLDDAGAVRVKQPGDGDWVVVAVDSVKALSALPTPKGAGPLWLVRPKGKASPVTETQSRDAARALGLVDVKVVAVSATHSAEKYVWPKARR